MSVSFQSDYFSIERMKMELQQSADAQHPPPYVRLTNESEGAPSTSVQSTMVVIHDDRNSRPVLYQPPPLVQSFSGHIMLSCCAFWCCGILFGAISFILAGELVELVGDDALRPRGVT